MQNDVTKTFLSNSPIKTKSNKERKALDVICWRLICQEGDLNRSISLEKEVWTIRQKNLKQQTLEKFF